MNQNIKERIDTIGNKEATRFFFHLINKLITTLDISPENERLAINIRNDSKKIISVNINGRLILRFKNGDELGFMIDEIDKEKIEHIIQINGFEKFEFETPQSILIYLSYEIVKNNLEVLETSWLNSCKRYLPTQTKSQYRRYHIDELYKMATNEQLLESYFMNSPQKNNKFKSIIEDLRIHFKAEQNVLSDFTISTKQLTNSWVWISDKDNIIGTAIAHYEICLRDRTSISIELHFENEKYNNIFLDSLKVLPQHIKWFERHNWNKKDLMHENILDIDDPNILEKISKEILYMDNTIGDEIREIIQNKIKIETENKTTKMSFAANQILYGPPGTGKTYHTIDRALQIIDSTFYNLNKSERNKINKRFKDLLINDWESGKGQIAFCTFHQSMSYEDFIEGIKPLQPKVDDKFIKYEVVDGIFKKICGLARMQTSTNGFDESYQQFVNDVIENNNFLELKTRKQLKPFTLKINSNQSVTVTARTVDATEMTITKEVIKSYFSEGEVKDWKPYSVPIAEYIKAKYPFSITETNHLKEPYVLIIDEINRGNVSQIFGELITLIEEDKRKGKEEELNIVLPYSKELFSVPANVYIIGTMNTADRSVEALDTALRRRFSFEFMPPDDKEIPENINGVMLREIFKQINERISFLLDKDHQIGHSYLMKVKTLEEVKEVFKNKIIPLLKEYFFNDYRKIHLVLGDGFVKKENKKPAFAVNDNEEMARDIYTIVPIDDNFNIETELNKTLAR